jgi:HK97 gp10 family phage protein
MKNIEFENLDEVLDRIESLMDVEKIDAALGKAAARVAADAIKKAPKGDGDLRRSIATKVEDYKGIVYTPLEYAPYVEYGTGLFAEEAGRKDVPWCYQDEEGEWHSTSGMPPQPYMRPALEENREEIKKILMEGITK